MHKIYCVITVAIRNCDLFRRWLASSSKFCLFLLKLQL